MRTFQCCSWALDLICDNFYIGAFLTTSLIVLNENIKIKQGCVARSYMQIRSSNI